MQNFHNLGKTRVLQFSPWGIYARNGHRLLCADGKIRAAELAETADTFFSVPASVRVNGRRVSGYMTTETVDGLSIGAPDVYVFRSHDCHRDTLQAWPSRQDLLSHAALVLSAL